jgi:hypothetical protein
MTTNHDAVFRAGRRRRRLQIAGRGALTAWTAIAALDDVDEKRFTRLIEAYRGIDLRA